MLPIYSWMHIHVGRIDANDRIAMCDCLRDPTTPYPQFEPIICLLWHFTTRVLRNWIDFALNGELCALMHYRNAKTNDNPQPSENNDGKLNSMNSMNRYANYLEILVCRLVKQMHWYCLWYSHWVRWNFWMQFLSHYAWKIPLEWGFLRMIESLQLHSVFRNTPDVQWISWIMDKAWHRNKMHGTFLLVEKFFAIIWASELP